MKSTTFAEWEEWNEVQKAAARAGLVEGDLPASVAILNRYLARDRSRAVRREAIAFRGTLYQKEGDLESAKSDFLAAAHLADEGYVRFELQDTLAELSRRLGDFEEADKYYIAALRSGAADPRVAGGRIPAEVLEVPWPPRTHERGATTRGTSDQSGLASAPCGRRG